MNFNKLVIKQKQKQTKTQTKYIYEDCVSKLNCEIAISVPYNWHQNCLGKYMSFCF